MRQFIVVLLVLLQFAAPLVHAHVDDAGPVHGLHLHEFEAQHIKSDALFVTASDYFASLPYAIVELGQLIKIQQQGEDFSAVYYLQSGDLRLVEQRIVETINFSPQVPAIITEPFLCQNSTRAPPAV